MTTFKVTISIEREFNNRANALSACDALTDKVPSDWMIIRESVDKV